MYEILYVYAIMCMYVDTLPVHSLTFCCVLYCNYLGINCINMTIVFVEICTRVWQRVTPCDYL